MLLIDTGSAWYLQLTSLRLYLLCRIQAKLGMWEHTVFTWWLRRGSSVQSSYANPQKWSQRWHSSQTPVAKYILLWFIIICDGQWFQSNAGSSYTCTLPNKTDTPRTSMQNFNGLQQFRNHFLLFSGTTPCWLQIIWNCEFCLENHWLTTRSKFREMALETQPARTHVHPVLAYICIHLWPPQTITKFGQGAIADPQGTLRLQTWRGCVWGYHPSRIHLGQWLSERNGSQPNIRK